MSIEMFWGSGSGPSWRVLLTLTVKKLAFDSHLLQFSKTANLVLELRGHFLASLSDDGGNAAVRDAFGVVDGVGLCAITTPAPMTASRPPVQPQ